MDWSDFHIIGNLSIADRAFVKSILMSFLLNEETEVRVLFLEFQKINL